MDSIVDIAAKQDFQNLEDVEFVSQKLEVKMSPVHGRGVFTKDILKSGQLIERYPLMPMAFRLRYHGDPMLLSNVLIHTSCPCPDCKTHGPSMFMQGGNGMYYNHQDSNNAKIRVNWDFLYAEIVATKIIRQDQEVYIDYGKNYPWEIRGMNKVTIEKSSPE